jgi:hypothetical protein
MYNEDNGVGIEKYFKTPDSTLVNENCGEFCSQCKMDTSSSTGRIHPDRLCKRETNVCSIDTLLSYGLLLVHEICSVSIMCNVCRTFLSGVALDRHSRHC